MKSFTHYEFETYHANKHRFADLKLRQLHWEIAFAEEADPNTESDFKEINHTLETARKELDLYLTLRAFKNAIDA